MIKLSEQQIVDVVRGNSKQRWYWENEYFDWRWNNLPRFDDQSVLEIGTHEGFFGFIAESRGASEVCCVESNASLLEQANLNKNQLGSKCEIHWGSVCDLNFDVQFDVALFMDVYYHLEDPMLALRNLRKASKSIIFSGCYLTERFCSDVNLPVMYCFEPYEYHLEDSTNVWVASLSCIKRMLTRTGFENQNLIGVKDDRFIMIAS